MLEIVPGFSKTKLVTFDCFQPITAPYIISISRYIIILSFVFPPILQKFPMNPGTQTHLNSQGNLLVVQESHPHTHTT